MKRKTTLSALIIGMIGKASASLGLDNITGTNSTINSSSPGLSLNQTSSKIGELGPAVAGTPEYSGLLVLIMFGAGLFKADVGTDVAGVVLIPTAIFLSMEGLFPTPNGVIYGILIGISAIVGFGVFRFAFR